LFEGGFEVFDDFLRENFGIRKVVGFFEAFVSRLAILLPARGRVTSRRLVSNV